MQSVKCGVIGLGWFGEKHCEVLSSLRQAELYAVCTRTESRLRALAGRFGVKHAYTSYREMLADPDLKVVSVVTMWDRHLAPTLAALRAGKHVFLEKPMASSLEDCDRIVEAARAEPGHLMVGHICRFNPRYVAAKQDIDAGRIGKIVSLYARRNLPRAVTEPVLAKIGPIIGDGVHDTDLMLWFTGSGIASAYAQTVNVRGLKYPDMGWTLYRFQSGAVGVCEDVWYLPERTPYQLDERMEIVGTEGAIRIHDQGASYTLVDGEGVHHPDTTYWPLRHGERAGALREEWAYFLDCVLEGREPRLIRPEESRAAVQACLAAEESAATGQVVAL